MAEPEVSVAAPVLLPTTNGKAKRTFYRTRLTHTLEHTQRSTGQIYLVNGGVLALLYFVAGAENLSADVKATTVVAALSALGVVNLLHARLIHIQQRWYREFSQLYSEAAGVRHPELKPRPMWPLSGTHRCYMTIHILLGALALGLAGYVMRGGADMFAKPDDLPRLVKTEVEREVRALGDELRAELRNARIAPSAPAAADTPK